MPRATKTGLAARFLGSTHVVDDAVFDRNFCGPGV
jgi:hypothetical protein